MEPTTAQAAVLAKLAASKTGRISSRDTNVNTITALEKKGLIKMVDRFPSGSALYAFTAAGRAVL